MERVEGQEDQGTSARPSSSAASSRQRCSSPPQQDRVHYHDHCCGPRGTRLGTLSSAPWTTDPRPRILQRSLPLTLGPSWTLPQSLSRSRQVGLRQGGHQGHGQAPGPERRGKCASASTHRSWGAVTKATCAQRKARRRRRASAAGSHHRSRGARCPRPGQPQGHQRPRLLG